MQAEIPTQQIALGGLAPIFSQTGDDKRTIFLVDHTGNAYTFFKYKAKLIDVSAMGIQMAINKKPKEEIIEEIRVGLAYGIKQGEVVVLHLGENTQDWDQFFKGQTFWEPKQLFAPCDKLDAEWFKKNVSKPSDKDMFGNDGPLYPSDKFLIMISFSKDVAFGDVKWLQGCKEHFRKVVIQ